MKVTIDYDNDSDGPVDLEAEDVPLLGVLPFVIRDGHVASYEFDAEVTLDDIETALDQESSWSTRAGPVIDEDEIGPEA